MCLSHPSGLIYCSLLEQGVQSASKTLPSNANNILRCVSWSYLIFKGNGFLAIRQVWIKFQRENWATDPQLFFLNILQAKPQTRANPCRITASQCIMLSLLPTNKIVILIKLENLFHIAKRIQSTVACVATCLNASSQQKLTFFLGKIYFQNQNFLKLKLKKISTEMIWNNFDQ